jgi:hypothetical protein
MWSELFDIDSLHDLVLMGKSAVLGAGIVALWARRRPFFRGLAAVCGQRSGLERAVSLPSDEAKAAFLHQHMSLRFRYRLRWTAWRYGAVYDGLEPTFLVEVLTRTFLKSFVCSLDPKSNWPTTCASGATWCSKNWMRSTLILLTTCFLLARWERRSRPEIQSCSSGSIIRRSRIVSTQSARL